MPQVHPDSREAKVPLDLLAFKDQLDSEEIQEPEVMLDLPEPLDHLDQLVSCYETDFDFHKFFNFHF